ncbi:hypothetical protein O181_034554 [Austropuccinia psidii MF-1]|uniref:Protein transport protein SFT2 n=1 Tax=Austropuccinia psidii MF-1 TaxID=1389203 RepID=A0A9Q3D106_9BASI|nr:hypothetical protein [Austropuccinia psidii MF-1]
MAPLSDNTCLMARAPVLNPWRYQPTRRAIGLPGLGSTQRNLHHIGLALIQQNTINPCEETMTSSNNAESNFRANLSGFKWARGVTDESATSQETSTGGNPFSRFAGSISGYVPLRSNERSNEEEAYYALSRWERTVGFLMCTAGALICFVIAFFTLPLLAIKPRKFAVAFSLGSLLFMIGFVVLQGPVQHFKHVCSTERLPFTLSYVASLASTLYFAIGLRSYLGTLIAGVVQVVVLLAYFLAYFPGGLTTLRFMGNIGLRGASSYLPDYDNIDFDQASVHGFLTSTRCVTLPASEYRSQCPPAHLGTSLAASAISPDFCFLHQIVAARFPQSTGFGSISSHNKACEAICWRWSAIWCVDGYRCSGLNPKYLITILFLKVRKSDFYDFYSLEFL